MQERPFDTLSPYTILNNTETPSLEMTDVDHPSASSGYATLYTSVVPAVEGSNTGVQSSGYGEVQITETPPSSSDYTYTSAEASQNIPPAPAIPSEGEAICEIKTDPNNQLFDSFLGVNRLPRRQVTLGKELGHGAFGDVYQGQWGDKTVALKKIDVAHAQESLKGAFYGESPSREHIIEALQWEISRLSTVSHPNVVQFYGIYQTVLEGHTYVVMEFCTGGTLDRALQEKDVPWSKRWQWAVEMTQGLAYLHDKGVLHRDLKAENILIDGNGCAKLADLGVAQADTLLAETEAKVVAKGLQDKHFIAPENIKHPTLSNVKTDIYAMGLVLWQLAVGRPDSGEEKPLPRFPGTGLSHKQCQEWSQGLALAEREPIPVDCPDGFRDLILVCWQHDPTKRPTASALLTQLYALGNAPDISHPEPALLATCEQLTNLIHAKRLEGLSYVAPYLTQYALSETIEDYWWRVEALADPKQDGNPPLNLLPTLDQFVKDADAQSLLLLGDSGLGKTLSTYLLADRLLADWWAYLHDPLKPMPAYLPVFVRPALSQWSHTVLREEGFAKVRDFYQLPKNPSFGLLLIVDGYDECQVGDAPLGNLASQLGILSRTPVKLLVTSRPHTVAKEQLRERFALNGQLQTNYFLPFKREQMLTYLTAQLSWDTETQAKYQTDLEQATALRTVLRNPFVLHLFVQSFPTLKDKNFQQLNRWQIYESAVEEWLRTHQGLLSETVRQKLTESQINLTSLVKSFAAFASSVAFTAFQQGNITLSQAEVAQLDSPWGRLREEVKQDGKEIFQGYRLALCTIHKEISPSIVQQLNYLERNKKKLTLPALIEWQSPEEGNRYFVYGLTADGEPQLTPLQTDVLPPALVFEKGEKLFVSAQQHPLLYQTITETKAHVKSADRRSLLSEADYLTILGERCKQFGEGAPLKQRSEGVEFTHKSFFEYFAAKRLIGLSQSRAIKAEGLSLLNARSLQEEPEVLGFWVEGWQSEWRPTLIEPLFEIVQSSREEETHTVAASNAATLLAKARVSFSGRDLHTVHIVGADLSGALLHFTNFREADLREVNLQGAFLRETDLRGAKMAGTAFGEFPRLSLKEEVRCTAISSDRSLMAVGLKNGTIVLFGGEHYSEKQGELKGHTRDVTSVAFSPDGKYLISGGMDFSESDSVRLWDVESQKSLAEWKWSQVLSVAFSTDGNCLAWGGLSNTIMLWNINAKKSITELKGHTSYILSLAFSPDGKLLASGSYDHTICLWNMESLMPLTELKGHTSYVSSIAFSSDGKLLASGSLDRTVRVWDMESQKLFTELKRHIQGVHSVAFSPDGKRLVSGGGNDDGSGEIFLWDIKSQKLLIELQGHTQGVHSVTFSLDGDIIISGSYDNTIRLWDIGLQKSSLYLKGHIDIVWSVAFSPDGKRLVSGGNRELFLWDMESQKFFTDLKGHTEAVHSVAFSPDGKRLVSGGNRELFLWDMELQKLFTDLKGHTEAVHSVAFSPDGKRLVSGGGGYENGELFLWDMESQKLFTDLKGHTEAVHSVTFSPDGKHLVSGSSNLILESEKLMARTPPVKEQLFLWDIEAKNSLTRLKGCKSRVNSVAFSPDGKHLVSGGGSFVSFDLQRGRRMTSYGIIPTELILWDIESKKLLTKLEGHTREVMSVAFSPDGKRLVSGSWDRTVRVWNMESLMPLAELKGHTHWVSSVAFSPDGKLLASGSADYAIFLWGCTNVDKQEMWVLKSRFVTAFVLCAVNAHLKGAGISPSNKALLLQNGAEDELPLTRERTTFIPNTDIELQALLSEGNRTLLKQQGANDIALVYGDFYIK